MERKKSKYNKIKDKQLECFPFSGGNRSESTGPNNTNTSRSSTLQQQRGSKGRWTNKNGESSVQSSIGRKEDFRVRPVLVNGYDLNTKEAASGKLRSDIYCIRIFVI